MASKTWLISTTLLGVSKVRICTAHAFSIGSFCQSASFIRKRLNIEGKNQRPLLPFDVVYSNPRMVVDCIRTRFSEFLCREKIDRKVGRSGHMTYDRLNQEFHNWSEKKSPCTFHHHDLTRDEVFDKYVKGCDYFLASIGGVPIVSTEPTTSITGTSASSLIPLMAMSVRTLFH